MGNSAPRPFRQDGGAAALTCRQEGAALRCENLAAVKGRGRLRGAPARVDPPRLTNRLIAAQEPPRASLPAPIAVRAVGVHIGGTSAASRDGGHAVRRPWHPGSMARSGGADTRRPSQTPMGRCGLEVEGVSVETHRGGRLRHAPLVVGTCTAQVWSASSLPGSEGLQTLGAGLARFLRKSFRAIGPFGCAQQGDPSLTAVTSDHVAAPVSGIRPPYSRTRRPLATAGDHGVSIRP